MESLRKSDTYDQNEWMHKCGTPACIFGHAAALNDKVDVFDLDIVDEEYIQASGADYMGIANEFRIVESLSNPRPLRRMGIRRDPINREAIKVLEILIETGKVNWRKAIG